MFMKANKIKSTFKIWDTVLLPSQLFNKPKIVISISDSTIRSNFSITQNNNNSKLMNHTEKESSDSLIQSIKKPKLLKKTNPLFMINKWKSILAS